MIVISLMETFRMDSISESDYTRIVSILRGGGVIAFPTDTAYGLGADPFNHVAVKRLFEIKGRPETKPILMLVNSIPMAESLAKVDSIGFPAVAGRFWPGPLTLIVPAQALVPEVITAGTATVGLRWPIAPFAISLMDRFHKPLTATSANQSGAQAAITAAEVSLQLGESVEALVDGGTLPSRTGSTVLDLTADPPVLLREGPISFDTLRAFFDGRIRKEMA
jgi:L-threonylcarbamoyladenylate synthase